MAKIQGRNEKNKNRHFKQILTIKNVQDFLKVRREKKEDVGERRL